MAAWTSELPVARGWSNLEGPRRRIGDAQDPGAGVDVIGRGRAGPGSARRGPHRRVRPRRLEPPLLRPGRPGMGGEEPDGGCWVPARAPDVRGLRLVLAECAGGSAGH